MCDPTNTNVIKKQVLRNLKGRKVNYQQRLYNFQLQQMKERPLRIFVQAQKISKHLYCPICHEVFDDPNRLGCGHTFCYMCIQQWATLSKVCPLCKKSLKHRRPQKDLIAASLIDQMQAKCSHQKCEWTGVYSSLKKHQRMCDYRQRKAFQSRNFDDIVQLHDDQEMKETNGINKNGKKKLKKDFGQLLPIFPSSDEQKQENLNTIDPLQRNVNKKSQVVSSQSSSNSYSQSLSNKSSSNSNNSSLNHNLSQLFHNLTSNRPHEDEIHEKMRDYISQTIQNKKEKKQKLTNHTYFNQQDGYLYRPDQIEKKNYQYQKNQLINLSDQQKPDIDTNYFIIQKNKKQQEKSKNQSKPTKSKWGLGYHLQMKKQEKQLKQKQIDDSQDSSSLSNPFNEPIIETKIKNPKPKSVIVIQSSEQSRCDRSLQSGEMSLCERKRFSHQKTSQKVQIQREFNRLGHYTSKQQYRDSMIEGYQPQSN